MWPPLFAPHIIRLSGRPRPEIAPNVPRPQGSRRQHHAGTVREVQALIEQTTLTYHQIAKSTGVSQASISRWMQDNEWKRPLFSPRAMDTMPTPRASLYLRHRTLARRITALAERYVRELEEAPEIDFEKLAQALELARMAKLATMRRTPSRTEAAVWGEPMRPIIELCSVGADIRRIPREVLDDFLENRVLPPANERPPRSRGMTTPKYLKEQRRHARLMERE